MPWSEYKTDSKVAIGALVFTILAFAYSEYKYLQKKSDEEFSAKVKLSIVQELTDSDSKIYTLKYEDLRDAVIKSNKQNTTWPWQRISDGEISQALYNLTKDRLVVYVGSSNAYEFASFNSAHNERNKTDEEQYNKSVSGIKLNIIEILKIEKRLTQTDIYQHYISKFGKKTKKHSIADALYELIKDEIVLFSIESGTFELKSFDSIHNLSTNDKNINVSSF